MENSGLNPKMVVPGATEEEHLSFRGNVLDRKKYEDMRDEYYRLRGWDGATGFQTAQSLEALDMDDVIEELKERELLG
ncbi:MAG: aldehyde ferredoxin oxidoreductase C-terminal domain-containing protein, partial [Desulfobacterales bacterium]